MRRRPMEFWWIAAYCVARAILVVSGTRVVPDVSDRIVLDGYASTLLCVPCLLFFFQPFGRCLGTVAMGVEAVELIRRISDGVAAGGGVEWNSALALAGCMWMSVYLQRPSTALLFRRDIRPVNGAGAPISYTAGFDLFSLTDVLAAVLAGQGALALGAPVWLALTAGVTAYVAYGTFAEEWLRQRWESVFARIEPGFPESEIRRWRSACGALARQDLSAASERFLNLPADARAHPAGRLFSMALQWHVLVAAPSANGRDALRRMAFDHDYNPGDDDRARVSEWIEKCGAEELRALVGERAEFIAALIQSASNPASFFRTRADRLLSRVTGEAFAFNAPESWAAWWRDNGAHWTGDAGCVALVARLLFRDCYAAALRAARKIAGRAEEPLLVELAAQIQFFTTIRDAARGQGAPASFVDHPLRVLLVPEWADAVGWLHADSPILANLNVSRKAAARRLTLRAKMLDYAIDFWKRYPADLNADLPWLLPLLAGKNFGMLRARAKFQVWWPKTRDAFVRYARAMNAGLDAYERGEIPAAQSAFLAAIEARSGELSARYNLALCWIKRGGRNEAESLLRELAAMEPKEPYWWMALGDLYRGSKRAMAARAAYRRAQRLGASEGRVALHLGLTFAHEDRDGEAMQLFARALGKNPTASKLEALAMQLENEGCWKLAGHYREEALRKELDGPGRGGESDSGERGDETSA